MGYATVIGIQLLNLLAAFLASNLAVSGDGRAESIHAIQIYSGAGIALATVTGLVLCGFGKASLGVKASMLTLPALFFLALMVLAGKNVPMPFFVSVMLLCAGWGAVIAKAKRRLNRASPTTIGGVILGSKFSSIEWVFLLLVACLAVFVWYQLLKLTV